MLKIEKLESPHPFAANSYLISSDGEYAVVDPTAPYRDGMCEGTVKYILLTHAHFDHILEVDSWVNATGAEVIISAAEADALSDPMRNCYKLYDGTDRGYFGERRGISEGDTIPLGDQTVEMLALFNICRKIFIIRIIDIREHIIRHNTDCRTMFHNSPGIKNGIILSTASECISLTCKHRNTRCKKKHHDPPAGF